MMEELKPCPFCGDANAYIAEDEMYDDFYRVHCIGCGCQTDYFETESDAAKAWNRRVKTE